MLTGHHCLGHDLAERDLKLVLPAVYRFATHAALAVPGQCFHQRLQNRLLVRSGARSTRIARLVALHVLVLTAANGGAGIVASHHRLCFPTILPLGPRPTRLGIQPLVLAFRRKRRSVDGGRHRCGRSWRLRHRRPMRPADEQLRARIILPKGSQEGLAARNRDGGTRRVARARIGQHHIGRRQLRRLPRTAHGY